MAVTRVTLDFYNKSLSVDIDGIDHVFSSVERFIELTNFPRGDCVNVVYELERGLFAVEYEGGIMLVGGDRPEIQWIDHNLSVIKQAAITDIEDMSPPPLTARHFRNSKLHETDWLMLRHQDEVIVGGVTTLSTVQLGLLATYRQNLRDMSEETLSATDIDSVDWPTPPSFLA